MAHDIGNVTNGGSEGKAHWQMLKKLKDFCVLHGWTVKRYDDTKAKRELILEGEGLSGTEKIYVGFRTYEDVDADYYNMTVAGFTGYLTGVDFVQQPGFHECGVCAHDQRIDYWLAVNGQRICFVMKLANGASYDMAYAGKIFPYANPSQFPYPVLILGTCNGPEQSNYYDIRYSDTRRTFHENGIFTEVNLSRGYSCYFNSPGGWLYNNDLSFYPYRTGTSYSFAGDVVPINGHYFVDSITLETKARQGDADRSVYGELDGVRYITGFSNMPENTVTIDGKTSVVFTNCTNSDMGDFFLLELD